MYTCIAIKPKLVLLSLFSIFIFCLFTFLFLVSANITCHDIETHS